MYHPNNLLEILNGEATNNFEVSAINQNQEQNNGSYSQYTNNSQQFENINDGSNNPQITLSKVQNNFLINNQAPIELLNNMSSIANQIQLIQESSSQEFFLSNQKLEQFKTNCQQFEEVLVSVQNKISNLEEKGESLRKNIDQQLVENQVDKKNYEENSLNSDYQFSKLNSQLTKLEQLILSLDNKKNLQEKIQNQTVEFLKDQLEIQFSKRSQLEIEIQMIKQELIDQKQSFNIQTKSLTEKLDQYKFQCLENGFQSTQVQSQLVIDQKNYKDNNTDISFLSMKSLIQTQKQRIQQLENQIKQIKSNKLRSNNSICSKTSTLSKNQQFKNNLENQYSKSNAKPKLEEKNTDMSVQGKINTLNNKQENRVTPYHKPQQQKAKKQIIQVENYQIIRQPRDGDCFFHSIKECLKLKKTIEEMRFDLASFIEKNIQEFEFLDEERSKIIIEETKQMSNYTSYDIISLAAKFYQKPIALYRYRFNPKLLPQEIFLPNTSTKANNKIKLENCIILLFSGKLNTGHFDSVTIKQKSEIQLPYPSKTTDQEILNSKIQTNNSQQVNQIKDNNNNHSYTKPKYQLQNTDQQSVTLNKNNPKHNPKYLIEKESEISEHLNQLPEYYCGCQKDKSFKNIQSLKSHFYKKHSSIPPKNSSHNIKGISMSFKDGSNPKNSIKSQ